MVYSFSIFSINYLLNTDLKVPIDAFGYYIGYFIGMLVDIIISAIFTGGTKTVADVLKIISKQFTEIYKFAKSTLKYTAKVATNSIEYVIDLLAKIKNGAKNIKPFLDEILEWLRKSLDDLVKKAKDIKRFGKITKEIMKNEMPKEFLEALKKLGKSEDEILQYYTNYHNNNDFIFLNQIEEILAKNKNITKTDAFTLWSYTTNHYYWDLNNWLRNGINKNQTKIISSLLTKALDKMPKYNGSAFRALEFNDKIILEKFLKNHRKGKTVTYNDFVSCGNNTGAAFFDKPMKNVFLKIEVKNAPIISDFSDGIKIRGYAKDELLLLQGRKLVIKNYKEVNGKHYFELIEK